MISRRPSPILPTLVAVVLAAWLGVPPGQVEAQTGCPPDRVVNDRFYQAQDLYVIRAFPEVRKLLEPLLRGECIQDRKLLRLTRLYLSVAFLEMDEEALAEKHILDMLKTEPDIQISRSVVSPYALKYIESVREENKTELNNIRRLQGSTDDVLLENFWLVTEVQRNKYWINFLPFGAGSFQNDESGWGIFFASAQLATLGLSLGGWIAVEALRGSTALFTAEEAAAARDAQIVQITGATAFTLLYVWSVIDGVVNYQPEIRIVLPPSDRYQEEILDEATSGVEWQLFPIAGPEVGGMGLRLTY